MNAGDWSEILEMPDVVDAGTSTLTSDIAVFQMNAGDWSEILEMPDVVDAATGET